MDATQDIPSPGHPWLCCRACLSTDGRMFNIHEYKLADAFADITGTPVAKDKLPQFLCSYCRTQLLKSASFRDMCLCTQKSLRSTLLKEKHINQQKWRWTGHMLRDNKENWSKQVTHWYPITRWEDDIQFTFERQHWKELEEAYADRHTTLRDILYRYRQLNIVLQVLHTME